MEILKTTLREQGQLFLGNKDQPGRAFIMISYKEVPVFVYGPCLLTE